MVEPLRAISPIERSEAPIQLTPLLGRGFWRLRSWSMELVDTVTMLGSSELPSKVGQVTHDSLTVLCVGPGEWLAVSGADRCVGDSRGEGLVVLNVTDAFVGIEARGPAVQTLLSKGCGLDLDPMRFRVGDCARTRFAKITVILLRVEASQFELYVARSLGYYLQDWLVDAAAELIP